MTGRYFSAGLENVKKKKKNNKKVKSFYCANQPREVTLASTAYCRREKKKWNILFAYTSKTSIFQPKTKSACLLHSLFRAINRNFFFLSYKSFFFKIYESPHLSTIIDIYIYIRLFDSIRTVRYIAHEKCTRCYYYCYFFEHITHENKIWLTSARAFFFTLSF